MNGFSIKNKAVRLLSCLIVSVCLLFALVGCIPVLNELTKYDDDTDDDVSQWVNELTTQAMQANFMIKTVSYNVGFQAIGNVTSSAVSGGSGVLFYVGQEKLFLLTNNHVIAKKSGYKYVTYSVTDYKGNEYDGNVSVVYSDAAYDLAVVAFEAGSNTEYSPLKLAEGNPIVGTRVAALGSPLQQFNALTLGKVLFYDNVTLSEEKAGLSDVKFEVIHHDAPINQGSSGGVLLNERSEIVGINFATAFSQESGEFDYGCAVPTDKIKEFLIFAGFGVTEDNKEVTYDKE